MARKFGAAGSDKIACGSAGVLDDWESLCYAAWIYVDTAVDATARTIISKGAEKVFDIQNSADPVPGGLRLTVKRGTTDTIARASTALSLNTWIFAAAAFEFGIAPRLYSGTLTTPVTELGYNLQQTGAGSITADAASELKLGNDNGDAAVMKGRIAHVGVWELKMLVDKLLQFQYGILTRPKILRGYWPLWGVATPEPDLSGNANLGTVTGATVIDHVPLRRYTEGSGGEIPSAFGSSVPVPARGWCR